MTPKAAWQALKIPLKLLVTGILLYLVFRKIDLSQVQEVYLQSKPLFFLLAMVAFVSSQVVSSSRLRVFFKAKGLVLPFIYNLKLYFLGMFYNLFLPGGIGGDAYKVYLLRSKFNKPGRKLLTAIFLDRLSGFWGMSGIATLLFTQIPELGIPVFLPASLYLIGSVVYFILLRYFFDIGFRIAAISHSKALAVQTLQVLSVVLILFALNAQGPFTAYLFTFLVSSLVSLFPFTVGGLGAREYVFVQAANLLPMEKHIALTISLSFYLISVIVALIGVYFAFRSREFALTTEENEKMKKREEAMAHLQGP
jgi:glycosyltransferase 2 family protein